jgi:hypothetical protein
MRDDRRWYENAAAADQRRMFARFRSTGADLGRKYWAAMAAFAVLAALVWLTMGEGSVLVFGKPVQLRLVPLVVIGAMALRTVLARHAEKIRRAGEKDSQ